jgi:hypothetical protein
MMEIYMVSETIYMLSLLYRSKALNVYWVKKILIIYKKVKLFFYISKKNKI